MLKRLIFIGVLVVSINSVVLGANLTLSPLYTVVGIVRIAINTVISPFVFTGVGSALISHHFSRYAKVIQDDALEFIAYGEKSEALSDVIEEARALSPELVEESDEMIALYITLVEYTDTV